MEKLLICQLSDTHISEDGYFDNIPVKKRFLESMEKVKKIAPDLLVISGDLAAIEGGMAIYKWLKQELEQASIPYLVIPGNHDSVWEMRQIFQWPGALAFSDEIAFELEIKGHKLYFLDSSSYRVSSKQIKWLTQRACLDSRSSTLIMHHPPTMLGFPSFEPRYALKDHQNLFHSLLSISNLKTILCGHYHCDATFNIQNKRIIVCPSTMVQIDPHAKEIKKIPEVYGFRIITIDENEKLHSSVCWI